MRIVLLFQQSEKQHDHFTRQIKQGSFFTTFLDDKFDAYMRFIVAHFFVQWKRDLLFIIHLLQKTLYARGLSVVVLPIVVSKRKYVCKTFTVTLQKSQILPNLLINCQNQTEKLKCVWENSVLFC